MQWMIPYLIVLIHCIQASSYLLIHYLIVLIYCIQCVLGAAAHRVNQLKWSSYSVGCKFGDIRPVLLACNAGLTDRIWSSVGLDHHPLH